MARIQRALVVAAAMVLAATLVPDAMAQTSDRSRRGSGRGFSSRSLLGLLGIEQVQKELKLSDENLAKVKELQEKLGGELREKFAALREMEDREKRSAAMSALRDEFDRKSGQQLREILPREQMSRLYQIRTQVRSVVDTLSSKYVAGKLKLTDDQKAKVAEIAKAVQAKRSEVFGGNSNATDEQRRAAYAAYRKNRTEADEKALALLTAEQKEALEKMKGEKIELPSRRRRQ